MARPRESFQSKYEKYVVAVPFCGCHIWTGPSTNHGYGRVTFGRQKEVAAHRAAYEHFVGEVGDTEVVMHLCDVPLCVNPHHLRKGSQGENIADKVSKNRQAAGSRHGMSKLSEDQASAILRSADSAKNLSKQFGISACMVRQIKSGMYWKHLQTV